MTESSSLDVAALREALSRANCDLTAGQLDQVVQAIVRQHEDPEEHDRGLIAERLLWSPDQRLQALQSFLAFVERARPSVVT